MCGERKVYGRTVLKGSRATRGNTTYSRRAVDHGPPPRRARRASPDNAPRVSVAARRAT